jgi:hypothetical protein
MCASEIADGELRLRPRTHFRVVMTATVAPPLTPALKPKPLSRLAASSSKPFHVWHPPQSPVRIEYSRELLRLLLPRQDGEYSSGVLYGARAAGALRVISARPGADLEPVGIFAARWCGEVFLTEPDILRLENMNQEMESGDATGGIALVIAGGYAGFFVSEPNGSMQTIQSYQEFPIRARSLQPNRAAKLLALAVQATHLKLVNFQTPWNFVRAKLVKEITRAKQGRLARHLRLVRHVKLVKEVKRVKEWMPVAMIAAAIVILTGCVFPPPYFSHSSPFTIQERDGQLRIALTPSALSPGARLQISDGEERRSIAISPPLTSVIYVPRTLDVHITLVR